MQVFYCIHVRNRIHFAEVWNKYNLCNNNLLFICHKLKSIKNKLSLLYEDLISIICTSNSARASFTAPNSDHPHSRRVFPIAAATYLSITYLSKQYLIREKAVFCSGFLAKLCLKPVPKVPLFKHHKQVTMQYVKDN